MAKSKNYLPLFLTLIICINESHAQNVNQQPPPVGQFRPPPPPPNYHRPITNIFGSLFRPQPRSEDLKSDLSEVSSSSTINNQQNNEANLPGPPPPPPPPQLNNPPIGPRPNSNARQEVPPHPPQRRPPPPQPHRPPRPVPIRGPPHSRILLRPTQQQYGPLIGPLPKRPQIPIVAANNNGQIPSIGQVLTLATPSTADSTPASTTATPAVINEDEFPGIITINDELNGPGFNSLEENFAPPPTADSLVGVPPELENFESVENPRTLSPSFKVQPRGHSGPVVISQVVPVKSFQSSSQLLTEPMADKQINDIDDFQNAEPDLLTADSQIDEKTYIQPRFYDPLSSRTFDSIRSHEKKTRENNSNNHRAQRLLSHHHHFSSTDNDIDHVIELVDCGGRDLGFCDMSSKYPGHMMGNLMSDCQELVYSGFEPVPDDIDELGDSNPVAKYLNSSKSAVRAQTGSWSWKPYTYESKPICDSELRFIRPGYARDTTGKWQVVVQTEDLPQRVAIDLCHFPEKPCHLMSDFGHKSKCVQRYNFQHLLAIDPSNLHSCPTIRAFKFPSSCVCHIEYPNQTEDFY